MPLFPEYIIRQCILYTILSNFAIVYRKFLHIFFYICKFSVVFRDFFGVSTIMWGGASRTSPPTVLRNHTLPTQTITPTKAAGMERTHAGGASSADERFCNRIALAVEISLYKVFCQAFFQKSRASPIQKRRTLRCGVRIVYQSRKLGFRF